MNIDELDKVNLTSLSQEVMRLIRKHCDENNILEKDLYNLIEIIKYEEEKLNKIKEFSYNLSGKL